MNKIPMRSGCFIPGNLRLNGLILALALGLTTLSSMANMSPSTNGRIHGRAPDVTGTPVILMPDGVTEVTNNAAVLWTAKPADFSLAPLEPSLTYLDADGDAALETGFTLSSPPGVAWAWKQGSTLLTPAQLNRPLSTYFPDGTKLTVSASVPVEVTSFSGLPNTQVRTLISGPFDVVVKKPLPPPKIWVNGTVYEGDSGFPSNGFLNASFQYYMNGTNANDNGNYLYSSNKSWVEVDNGEAGRPGTVTFAKVPKNNGGGNVVISITPKDGTRAPHIHRFRVGYWYYFVPTPMKLSEAQRACKSIYGDNSSLAGFSVLQNSAPTRELLDKEINRDSRYGLINTWGDYSYYNNAPGTESVWTPSYYNDNKGLFGYVIVNTHVAQATVYVMGERELYPGICGIVVAKEAD